MFPWYVIVRRVQARVMMSAGVLHRPSLLEGVDFFSSSTNRHSTHTTAKSCIQARKGTHEHNISINGVHSYRCLSVWMD